MGSAVFLVIQMVILLDFVHSWNANGALAGEEDQSWYYALLGVTVVAYGGSLTLSALMFHWFKPSGVDCSFNVSLITVALLLCVAFSVMSLLPAVTNNRGSIFPASVVSLYCIYLCFSAMQSEPKDYECNGLAQAMTAASGTTLATGMVLTLLSVVYAAFRAGSNTRLFTMDGSLDGGDSAPERAALLAEQDEEGLTSAGLDGIVPPSDQAAGRAASRSAPTADELTPVTYNYSFFHLIFALASMYIAMLMTGWGTQVRKIISKSWNIMPHICMPTLCA